MIIYLIGHLLTRSLKPPHLHVEISLNRSYKLSKESLHNLPLHEIKLFLGVHFIQFVILFVDRLEVALESYKLLGMDVEYPLQVTHLFLELWNLVEALLIEFADTDRRLFLNGPASGR